MSLHYRSLPTFFAQAPGKFDSVLEQKFFLLYCGKGFTDVGVSQMVYGERIWHVQRLQKQLEDEKKAQEAQARAQKAKMKK